MFIKGIKKVRALIPEAAEDQDLKLPPSLLYPLMKQLSDSPPKGEALLVREDNAYTVAADASERVLPSVERALAFADKLAEYLRETKGLLKAKRTIRPKR